jgi:AAA domain
MAVDPSRAAAVALEAPRASVSRQRDNADELRSQANALHLIDHYAGGGEFGRADAKGRLHGRCPLPRHDDTHPSFALFPDGGYICSCGSGDVLRLYVELQGSIWQDRDLPRYESELRGFLGLEQRNGRVANGVGKLQREETSSSVPTGTTVPTHEEPQPFALELGAFIDAKSDAPPALIGSEDDILQPTHGLLLLVAKGGKGKTTIVLDQAFHLASGVAWLGFDVPHPLRVLFIENEGPREPFRRKLEEKRKSWPHPIKGAIYVYDEDWGEAKLNRGAFVERLNRFVAEEQIDLVIGDPLDTLGMEGVGSPEDTRNMVACLQQAGLFSKVAWELLHHSRKETVADAVDEASGAWAGKPDTLLVLEKQSGNRARLSFPKVRWSRRGERGAYLLAFDPDSESFELLHEESTEERDLPTEIAELLDEQPNLTAKQIAAKDSGIGANVDRIKDVLRANPDRFTAHTGEEAKALGRHPSATVWELTRASESPESPDSLGDARGEGDSVTPPLRESPVPTESPAPSTLADSKLKSAESPRQDRDG